MLQIFNVTTDVNPYSCKQGLYKNRKRVCTENWNVHHLGMNLVYHIIADKYLSDLTSWREHRVVSHRKKCKNPNYVRHTSHIYYNDKNMV